MGRRKDGINLIAMHFVESKIASADWAAITQSMHDKGYAIIPNLLSSEVCEELKKNYENPVCIEKQ